MRSSLSELIGTDKKITLETVVKNASYEDGTPVGESTIYTKDKNGEYLHQDIRNEISGAKTIEKRRIKKQVEILL